MYMTPVVETLTGGILNQVKKNLKKKIASSKFVQKSPTPLVCFFRRDLFLGVSCHFVFFSGAPGSVYHPTPAAHQGCFVWWTLKIVVPLYIFRLYVYAMGMFLALLACK